MIEITDIWPLAAAVAVTSGWIGLVLGVVYAGERDEIRRAAREARRELDRGLNPDEFVVED